MLHQSDNMLHAPDLCDTDKYQQLDKISKSATFSGSENLISFLQFLVKETVGNPDAQVKEHAIATAVFGRSNDFDPRIDSVVRVQAKRLRQKLQEYYETEGKADSILIELPKGHYKITFSLIEPPPEVAIEAISETDLPVETISPLILQQPETVTAVGQSREKVYRNALISVAIILAVVVASWVFVGSKNQPLGPAVVENKLGIIWEPFLKDTASTLVVLSNPPLYRFSNDSDPESLLKDSMKIPKDQISKLTKELKSKPVLRQDREPRLILSSEDYTGMGEAIGLFQVTNLLQSAGKNIILKQSRTISAEDLKNHNVILLGSAWVNDWVEKLPIKEDFTYSVHATILNNAPQTGEAREYRPVFNQQTGELVQDYALITVRPGVSDAYRIMTLSGILSEGTQAAAEYVTRKENLETLNQRLHLISPPGQQPKYYQVLLKVDVDNNIPTTVSVLAVHRLEAN